MIKTLLRSSKCVRKIQLAVLVLLTASIVIPTWAESESADTETANRLSDIPYIDCFIKSADRYAVDVELAIAIAIVESSLNPEAVSSSDAIGVMQIKWPLTAEHLGITDRKLLFDPCINIDAGVSYLKELLDLNADIESGDPQIQALASYHLGPTTIASTATLPQKATDYADAVFKQRDILIEEEVSNGQNDEINGELNDEQSGEQSGEQGAGGPAEQAFENVLAEGPTALRGASNDAEEDLEINAPDGNLTRERRSTNTFSNQALGVADVVQQRQGDATPLKPVNPCSTAGVRSLILDTHNPTERGEKFRSWLKVTGVNCTESQLFKLRNSLPLWLGTALNSELLGAVEMLIEAKSEEL